MMRSTYVSDCGSKFDHVGWVGHVSGDPLPNSDQWESSSSADGDDLSYDTDEEWAENPHQHAVQANLHWHDQIPLRWIYNNLMRACAVRGDPQQASLVLKQMEASGLRPNLETYTELINSCSPGNAVQASVWMQKMYDEGLTADRALFVNMLKICAVAGDGMRATTWFAKMTESHHSVTRGTYDLMLVAYALSRDWKRMGATLVDMINNDYLPRVPSILLALLTTLRNLERAQKDGEIRQALHMMVFVYTRIVKTRGLSCIEAAKEFVAEAVSVVSARCTTSGYDGLVLELQRLMPHS